MPSPYSRRTTALLIVACWISTNRITPALPQSAATQTLTGSATGRPLIPRSVIFGYPERTAPSLSPNGLQIAYLRPVNGTEEVWVRTLGTTDDHPVTTLAGDQKGNVTELFWHADGSRIIYQRDPLGDASAPLFIEDMTTGKARNLTRDAQSVQMQSYDPRFPDTLLISMNKDGQNGIYRMNLKTGEAVFDTKEPPNFSYLGWIIDGILTVRGYTADIPDGGRALWIRDDAHSPWRELLRWGPNDFVGADFVSPNTKQLWMLTSLGSDTTHIETIDAKTGERHMLVPGDPKVDMSAFWGNPKTGELDIIQFNADRYRFVFRDKKVEADVHRLQKMHVGEISNFARNPDDTKWVVSFETNAATWWYLYDRVSRKATPIYEDQPAFDRYKFATKTPIHFHARDGMLLHGYITLPVDRKPHQKLPMVVLVHGGPEHRDNWGYDTWAMWLADRGYAVLQINFRGSEGYGMRYLTAGYHQWSKAMRTDLLDGKAWAIEHGYADPSRVCIMGGSYGGYSTLAALAFTPTEFACGVSLARPSDLVAMMKDHPGDNDFARELGSDIPELTAASPINYADRFVAPVLILQGGSDHNVHPYQSEMMVKALRDKGRPVEYYVFSQERHGLADEKGAQALDAMVEQFLGKHTGGRVEPPSPEETATLAEAKR